MKGLVARIALQGATFAFDRLYTYAIPTEMREKAQKGVRVIVPFGRGNIKKQGMIFIRRMRIFPSRCLRVLKKRFTNFWFLQVKKVGTKLKRP